MWRVVVEYGPIDNQDKKATLLVHCHTLGEIEALVRNYALNDPEMGGCFMRLVSVIALGPVYRINE